MAAPSVTAGVVADSAFLMRVWFIPLSFHKFLPLSIGCVVTYSSGVIFTWNMCREDII